MSTGAEVIATVAPNPRAIGQEAGPNEARVPSRVCQSIIGTPEVRTLPMNVFFRLVAAASAAFVITILAMVAVLFSDPRALPARLLNAYGGWILVCEVTAIIVGTWLALAIDRHRSRGHRQSPQAALPAEPHSGDA